MKYLLLIGIFWLQSNSILACNCVGKDTITTAFLHSDYVFLALILSKEKVIVKDKNLPSGFVMERMKYKVRLIEKYKGELKQNIVDIVTGIGNGDCGYNFKTGRRYIIYSVTKNKYFDKGEDTDIYFYTDVCSRTRENNYIERRRLNKIRVMYQKSGF